MSGTKPKRKGVGYERELVRKLSALGFQVKRTWGSTGRSIGLDEEVDLILEGYTVQCRRRRKLPAWMHTRADMLMCREDRGQTYVVMPLNLLVEILQRPAG